MAHWESGHFSVTAPQTRETQKRCSVSFFWKKQNQQQQKQKNSNPTVQVKEARQGFLAQRVSRATCLWGVKLAGRHTDGHIHPVEANKQWQSREASSAPHPSHNASSRNSVSQHQKQVTEGEGRNKNVKLGWTVIDRKSSDGRRRVKIRESVDPGGGGGGMASCWKGMVRVSS